MMRIPPAQLLLLTLSLSHARHWNHRDTTVRYESLRNRDIASDRTAWAEGSVRRLTGIPTTGMDTRYEMLTINVLPLGFLGP